MNLNELLFVDDNEQALAMVSRIATAQGYKAVTATGVAEFMHAYEHGRPTLILIDVLLYGEDCGNIIDFLARCRCTVPIVLITGFTPQFMDVLESRFKACRLNLTAKIEKKRTLFVLEDLLKQHRIPEIDDDKPLPSSSATKQANREVIDSGKVAKQLMAPLIGSGRFTDQTEVSDD